MISSPQLAARHIQDPGQLQPCLEKIIDKKVNNIALGLIESLVDFFCRYLYSSYSQRLEFRMKEMSMDASGINEDEEEKTEVDDQKTAEKICHFMDGTPLYDRTASGRAEIKREKLVDAISKKDVDGDDYICIDGKRVYFSTQANVKLLFGKNHGTAEAYVTDLKECPELVMIYERETNRNVKAWCLDTTQPTKKVSMGGQLVVAEEEIFIAQSIVSPQATQPIVDQII